MRAPCRAGIRPSDLRARGAALLQEQQRLQAAKHAVAFATQQLALHTAHVEARHASLSALMAKAQALPPPSAASAPGAPGIPTPLFPSLQQPPAPEQQPQPLQPLQPHQHPTTPLVSALSTQLSALSAPQRALDYLHDLILPPHLEHTARGMDTQRASASVTDGAARAPRKGPPQQQQQRASSGGLAGKWGGAGGGSSSSPRGGLRRPVSAHASPASPNTRSASPRMRPQSAGAANGLSPEARKQTLLQHTAEVLQLVHSCVRLAPAAAQSATGGAGGGSVGGPNAAVLASCTGWPRAWFGLEGAGAEGGVGDGSVNSWSQQPLRVDAVCQQVRGAALALSPDALLPWCCAKGTAPAA